MSSIINKFNPFSRKLIHSTPQDNILLTSLNPKKPNYACFDTDLVRGIDQEKNKLIEELSTKYFNIFKDEFITPGKDDKSFFTQETTQFMPLHYNEAPERTPLYKLTDKLITLKQSIPDNDKDKNKTLKIIMKKIIQKLNELNVSKKLENNENYVDAINNFIIMLAKCPNYIAIVTPKIW